MLDNTATLTVTAENAFTPVITSSPTKYPATSLLHYGDNNLDLSVSQAVLACTPTLKTSQKWKNVEKCRGVNSRFNLRRADKSNVMHIESTASLLPQQHMPNFLNNYEEISELESLSGEYSFVRATESKKCLKNVQRMHFEAGEHLKLQ